MSNGDSDKIENGQEAAQAKTAAVGHDVTRRQALAGMALGAAGAAAAFPTIVPSRVLGRDGAIAPSDKINLGVIGIGPRCTYVLTSMLGLSDVRCVAIADVQKSRREAGKSLVDKLSGNSDCVLYRDMRDMLARKDIDAVIVATGASAIWLGLESETRLRGRGVSSCATCDGFFFKGEEVAVVGGGDTALEEALFLTRFATKVHLLVRRDAFRGSKIMVARAQAHEKIKIHLNREVVEVLGEKKTEALVLKDTQSGATERLAVGGLFVAIGHKPNTELLGGALPVDAAGYLQVKPHSSASAIDGVFVAGDVHDHRYRQAVTAAGDGCRAALDAERWLSEQEV